MKGRSIGLFFLLVISGCRDYVTREMVTIASLHRLDSVLSECRKRRLLNSDLCLSEYAKIKGLNSSDVVMDGYGNQIITDEKKSVCTEKILRHPYSVGKNAIDECGKGDDIVL